MACETCGARIPAGAHACPVCGAEVATPATPGGTAGSDVPPPTPGTPPPPGGVSPPRQGAPPGGGPAPVHHRSGLPSEARNWALAGHLSALAGAWIGLPVLGPLVVWLIRRDHDAFSERHAREALNFNITLLLVTVVALVATIPLVMAIGPLVLLPLVVVGLLIGFAWFVLSIVAAAAAADGREYRYPGCIRFLR